MGGTKMSKSLGNVVRPADLLDNYGASLIAMSVAWFCSALLSILC